MRDQRRFLLLALVPVVLLLLLATGMRFLAARSEGRDAAAAAAAGSSPEGGPEVSAVPIAPVPPAPEEADPKVQKALETAVLGQIACFGKDDYKGALEYAEPAMRANMTPDGFKNLVEGGYALLTQKPKVSFDRARIVQGRAALLPAKLLDGDGREVVFLYSLNNVEGQWFIGGVSPTGPPPSRGGERGPGAPPPGNLGSEVREL